MKSVELLQGEALTQKDQKEVYKEYGYFKHVLKHHENTTFADAKYLINKNRQERLRLPERVPPEETMSTLRDYTMDRITTLVTQTVYSKPYYIELRNLICSRITLFYARRGEPSGTVIDQWKKKEQWFGNTNIADLTDKDREMFDQMMLTYCTGKGNTIISCITLEKLCKLLISYVMHLSARKLVSPLLMISYFQIQRTPVIM